MLHPSICGRLRPASATAHAPGVALGLGGASQQPAAPLPSFLHLRDSLRAASACLAGLVCSAALAAAPPPAAASIPLNVPPQDAEAQRVEALRQLVGRYPTRSRAAPPPADAPEPTSVRIQRLQQLMAAGREAEAAGDYAAALRSYDAVVQLFPDFATTEYARLARARVLYQLGQVSSAILQLEDLEVTLRGYAEVHAALAAILYVERPALLELAEQQWEIAMEFNQQFADRGWVSATKQWPPRLMVALDRFLALS